LSIRLAKTSEMIWISKLGEVGPRGDFADPYGLMALRAGLFLYGCPKKKTLGLTLEKANFREELS
jgi:hypothetical protein